MDMDLKEAIQIVTELARQHQTSGSQNDAIKMLDLFVGKPFAEVELTAVIEGVDGSITDVADVNNGAWETLVCNDKSRKEKTRGLGYKRIATLTIIENIQGVVGLCGAKNSATLFDNRDNKRGVFDE